MGSVTEAVKGAQVSACMRTCVSVLDRLHCIVNGYAKASLPLSAFQLASQIELAAVTGPRAKAIRLLRLTRIFAAELLGSLIIIPYGDHSCVSAQVQRSEDIKVYTIKLCAHLPA